MNEGYVDVNNLFLEFEITVQHMVEAKQHSGEEIKLWMITDKDYSKLRTLEGCKDLADLGATKTDAVHILNFAKGLGVTNDNIIRNDAPSIKDLKVAYKDLLTWTRKLSVEKKEHTLLVYAGGHGASQKEQ